MCVSMCECVCVCAILLEQLQHCSHHVCHFYNYFCYLLVNCVRAPLSPIRLSSPTYARNFCWHLHQHASMPSAPLPPALPSSPSSLQHFCTITSIFKCVRAVRLLPCLAAVVFITTLGHAHTRPHTRTTAHPSTRTPISRVSPY